MLLAPLLTANMFSHDALSSDELARRPFILLLDKSMRQDPPPFNLKASDPNLVALELPNFSFNLFEFLTVFDHPGLTNEDKEIRDFLAIRQFETEDKILGQAITICTHSILHRAPLAPMNNVSIRMSIVLTMHRV
jgi:hypothetical protein